MPSSTSSTSKEAEVRRNPEIHQFRDDVVVGLDRLVDGIDKRDIELEFLRKEHSKCSSKISKLDKESKAAVKRAEDRIKELKDQAEEIEKEKKRLAELQSDLARQKADLVIRIEELEKLLADSESKSSQRQRAADELEQQVAELMEERDGINRELAEMRQKAVIAMTANEYNYPEAIKEQLAEGKDTVEVKKKTFAGVINLPSAGIIGSHDAFVFDDPNSADLHEGQLGEEVVIRPDRAHGTSAAPGGAPAEVHVAPMTPNYFVQTKDMPSSTFLPGQGLTCSPEFLDQAVAAYNSRLGELKQLIDIAQADEDDESFEQLNRALKAYADESKRTILALSCIPPGSDIEKYDDIQETALKLQAETAEVSKAVSMYATSRDNEAPGQRLSAIEALDNCQQVGLHLKKKAESLLPHGKDVDLDDLAAMLEEEIRKMKQAINKAIASLDDIQRKSSNSSTKGEFRIEVDNRILDACKQLARAIQEITEAADKLQREIEKLERGALPINEFYRRNARWTQGLISSAKEITNASIGFVKAADDAVSHGKLEEFIVYTEEVSAATIRLAVSSRVKAPRHSAALPMVMDGTRKVSKATADVVLEIRRALKLVKQAEMDRHQKYKNQIKQLDFYETNRLEMESRIAAKRLETELEKEHRKLRELRKHHAKLVKGDDAKRLYAENRHDMPSIMSPNAPASASSFAKQVLSATPQEAQQFFQTTPTPQSATTNGYL